MEDVEVMTAIEESVAGVLEGRMGGRVVREMRLFGESERGEGGRAGEVGGDMDRAREACERSAPRVVSVR